MDEANENTKAFEAALSVYTNALSSKIQEINKLWNTLQQGWDHWIYEDFKRSIHSLHGSSGIYGFTTMCSAAEKIERILNDTLATEITSEQNKIRINQLLAELESAAKTPDVNPVIGRSQIKNTSNKIYILNPGYQVDNSNTVWAKESINQLKLFNFEANYFTTVEEVEQATKQHQPIAVLVNFAIIENLDRDRFAEFRKQYLSNSTIIYFGTNGDFDARLKAVKSGGQAYLVKPFTTDELLYEIDKVIRFKNDIYRILIIDDDTEVADYYIKLIQQSGMQARALSEARHIEKILHEFKPDLILSDIYMPECNGDEIAAIIRQQRSYEFIPIIYLSVEENIVKQANALSLGADDFVTKKASPDYLIKIIKNKCYRYKLLKSITTKDNLTVADNLDTITHKLEHDLKIAAETSTTMSIAIVEIENMPKIISSYGYTAGDQVLKSLSLLLRNCIRLTDTVGRFSDNKFIVLLPDRDIVSTKSFILELQKRFLSLNYYHNNQMFNASFVAGVASSFECTDMSGLIKAAENALSNKPL